jgi:hypothetical protein
VKQDRDRKGLKVWRSFHHHSGGQALTGDKKYDLWRSLPKEIGWRRTCNSQNFTDPPVAGAGRDTILFPHIRRRFDRPSSGYATTAEENPVKLIRFLRADVRPHFALFPLAAGCQTAFGTVDFAW